VSITSYNFGNMKFANLGSSRMDPDYDVVRHMD
jgi:hypothetical protein